MTVAGDAYKVLQVDPEAEDEVIAAAYRRLARKYHPDVAPGDEAAARMAAINAAWGRIGTPTSRAEYDRERAAVAAATAAAERARADAAARNDAATARPPTTTTATRTGSPPRPPEPESMSRDWSSGRSTVGGGYDASMHRPDGHGAAGPAPGNPSGSVLNFGRYAGWSLGEVARRDIEYLEWLDRMPIGRPYREEIDQLLRRGGRRRSADAESTDRRGLFRRR